MPEIGQVLTDLWSDLPLEVRENRRLGKNGLLNSKVRAGYLLRVLQDRGISIRQQDLKAANATIDSHTAQQIRERHQEIGEALLRYSHWVTAFYSQHDWRQIQAESIHRLAAHTSLDAAVDPAVLTTDERLTRARRILDEYLGPNSPLDARKLDNHLARERAELQAHLNDTWIQWAREPSDLEPLPDQNELLAFIGSIGPRSAPDDDHRRAIEQTWSLAFTGVPVNADHPKYPLSTTVPALSQPDFPSLTEGCSTIDSDSISGTGSTTEDSAPWQQSIRGRLGRLVTGTSQRLEPLFLGPQQAFTQVIDASPFPFGLAEPTSRRAMSLGVTIALLIGQSEHPSIEDLRERRAGIPGIAGELYFEWHSRILALRNTTNNRSNSVGTHRRITVLTRNIERSEAALTARIWSRTMRAELRSSPLVSFGEVLDSIRRAFNSVRADLERSSNLELNAELLGVEDFSLFPTSAAGASWKVLTQPDHIFGIILERITATPGGAESLGQFLQEIHQLHSLWTNPSPSNQAANQAATQALEDQLQQQWAEYVKIASQEISNWPHRNEAGPDYDADDPEILAILRALQILRIDNRFRSLCNWLKAHSPTDESPSEVGHE